MTLTRQEYIESFKKKDEDIINYYLQVYTLEETGKKFKITRERVRQIILRCEKNNEIKNKREKNIRKHKAILIDIFNDLYKKGNTKKEMKELFGDREHVLINKFFVEKRKEVKKDKENRIVEFYLSGKSTCEIAKIEKYKSPQGVLYILEKNNIERRDIKGKITKEIEKEILEMRSKNKTYKYMICSILQKFDIKLSDLSIFNVLKRNGVVLSRGKTSKEREQQFIKMYLDGTKIKDIIKQLKISIVTIYKILKRNNIEKRKKISEEQEQEIINAYINKVKIKNIGKNFNISTTLIYKILKRNNIEKRGKKEK